MINEVVTQKDVLNRCYAKELMRNKQLSSLSDVSALVVCSHCICNTVQTKSVNWCVPGVLAECWALECVRGCVNEVP